MPISKFTNRSFVVFLLFLSLTFISRSSTFAGTPTHWGGAVPPALSSPAAMTGTLVGGLACDETLGMAGPYPCHNVDLLGYIPANVFGGFTTADIWGWTDPETGKEYALVSHSMATSFVDVSDPVNPILIGELPAPVPNVLWRDVKVYKDHAFIVGDGDFVLPHGIQIFDLTQLREVSNPPVVFSMTARYLGVGNTHNFAINEETGVGYAVGSNTCNAGLHMIDLNDPTNPVFLGCFSADGYTHDVQCVVYSGPDTEYTGHEICIASNEDTVTIVDVTDKSDSAMLSRQGYAGYGYTHQGSLTEDQSYFILGDELDEQNDGHNTYSYIWDVSDLNAPIHFSTYVGPTTAIDHNLYVVGDYVFESNYAAGLRILNNGDIANGNLTEVAYFDTHPASDVNEFVGTWSNYPFFKSGIVIVSNIEDGLYILKPNLPGYPTQDPVGDAEATGGGWLATTGSKKINFGFDVENIDGNLAGDLQLNDKAVNAKIQMDNLTNLGDGAATCGSITPGATVAELTGDGTFNGTATSFRVCISDNGEPGQGNDGFYLECTKGCNYNTGTSALDNIIDGGNIQVSMTPSEPDGDPEAVTIILDPLLLTEGVTGQLQIFSVQVFDQNQQLMGNTPVTLTRTAASGTITTYSAVTDLTGVAVFSVLNLTQTVEFLAVSGEAESNTIQVSPILP